MSTADIIALCASLPTVIAAIAAAVIAILNRKQTIANGNKIEAVHGLVETALTQTETNGETNAP